MKILNVILKISERCNLRCTYCYFFFGGDNSFESHRPVIKSDSLENIINFLQQGCIDYGLENISIIFHGGEPLLVKKQFFDEMCTLFTAKLSPHAKVDFNLQTNALLIDKEWVNLFKKHAVGVGVSIDGPKEYHDRYRIDHKSQGSYDRTIEKIHFMRSSGFSNIGCLSVINKDFDAKKIYHHLVRELGFNRIDLLLPDFTHDTLIGTPVDYGRFLCDLFDEWITDDNPEIVVRYCSSIARLLMGKQPLTLDLCSNFNEAAAITISSDGDLYPDDTLKSTDPHFSKIGYTVINTKLRDFLDGDFFKKLQIAEQTLPEKCKTCCWQVPCHGGQTVHRYSVKNGFNNPSVYCDGLQLFYTHVANTLIHKGVPSSLIEAALMQGL